MRGPLDDHPNGRFWVWTGIAVFVVCVLIYLVTQQ
jgi:hypothetical protein